MKSVSSYTAQVSGAYSIELSLPTFDYYHIGANVYQSERSRIRAVVDGDTTAIFAWKSLGNSWDDKAAAMCWKGERFTVLCEQYGIGYSNQVVTPAQSDWLEFMLGADRDDGNHKTMRVRWNVPYEWQGKTVELLAHVVWREGTTEGKGYSTEPMDFSLGRFAIPAPPAVSVMLMTPMLAFDKEHIGKTMIPYAVQASQVNAMKVTYTNRRTGSAEEMTVDRPSTSGYIYLPADVPMSNVRAVCEVTDQERNRVTVTSDAVEVALLHLPRHFNAQLVADGQVRLSWTMDYPLYSDIVDNDLWEVQRNLTGSTDDDDSQWLTIGQVPFSQDSLVTFTDGAFLSSYRGNAVAYRVRRMGTSVWGWNEQAGRQLCVMSELPCLRSPSYVCVQKAADWEAGHHVVELQWNGGAFDEAAMKAASLGDAVAMNGKAYATRSEADAQGGGTWGVLCAKEPYFVVLKAEDMKMPGRVENYDPFHLFDGDAVPDGFVRTLPLFRYWNSMLVDMGDEAGYGDDYCPTLDDNIVMRNLHWMLTSPASDGRTFEGLRDDMFYVCADSSMWYFARWSGHYQYHIRKCETVYSHFYVRDMAVAMPVSHCWDVRAKLLLYIDMKDEEGRVVATECRDLSSDTDIMNKGRCTVELTRKCVDYDFRLVVKRGTSPLFFADSSADSLTYAARKLETGEAAIYRFMNPDSITALAARQQQSAVELTWQNTGGDSDFYRVLRREHGSDEGEAWDTLATNLTQLFFIDRTPRPQHVYDYRVEAVMQCEGMKVNGQTVTGQCAPTGMVRGYVRLADGTGLPGLTVTAQPLGDIAGASIATAVTDSTGCFVISGLVYQREGSYRISVETMGDAGSFEPQTVTFDEDVNMRSNFIFILNTYYIYSGNVYYEGSSIPVPGVQFRRDGVVVVDANQRPVTTDSRGAFSISIPKGTHRVQAVKEGHRLKNDGYLLNPHAQTGDARDWNWTADVSTVRLWDQTRVLLHGRVVGGNDQGMLPLGQSLSRNNLGDSLKIVLQLEGDNTSYMVYDPLDPTVKERTEVVAHGRTDTTAVMSNRRAITIRPDNRTGEYEVMLYPVKYKVTEVSANGYSTLFQEGKVGETLDLTARQLGDTATYSRIYHCVPALDVVQFNPGNEQFFGIKQYQCQDNIGNKAVVQLWDKDAGYALGAPVFMAGTPYGWMLTAVERYHYNNDVRREADEVRLKGGEVTFNNGLVSSSSVERVVLDSLGGGSYVFTPQNTTFTLEDDRALKTVAITLNYDGAFFDIPAIKGFVMASTPKVNGRRVVAKGTPHLIDILRDPPGGGSSAYLEEGSKLSYTYSANIDATAGFDITKTTGTTLNNYTGVIAMAGAAGTEAGVINEAMVTNNFSFTLATYFGWAWNYSYSFDITERIQTSSAKKWVGPKADLFIGMTENYIMQDAVAVRVVPDSIYRLMTTHQGGTYTAKDGTKVAVKAGTMKVLAQGTDATGKPVYLIRDEVLGVGTQVSSTFVHSQFHIETELLPSLIKVRNALILPVGTDATLAQALADKQGFPAYVSLVDEDDKTFALNDATGKPTYVQYNPKGADKARCRDSIAALNDEVMAWLRFLVKNEEEKVTASELVKNYDFDGAANVQYSETFTCAQDRTAYLRWPFLNGFGGGTGQFLGSLGKWLENIFSNGKVTGDPQNVQKDGGEIVSEVIFANTAIKFKFKPILSVNVYDKNNIKESWSKKIGFTLSTAGKSNLNVDVYRTKKNFLDITQYDLQENVFYKLTTEYLDNVRNGSLGTNATSYMDKFKTPVYSGFVYRTRGGATCQPYEDERTTKYYNPGTVLDARTVEIDKLRIWTEQAIVSNVPYDEPARFTLYMANESELPDQASLAFRYFLDNTTNAKGAKVYVDGNALNGDGYSVMLRPGQVVTKQVEVYPNSDFDYENIGICLYDTEDAIRISTTLISAHFVPSAGKVKVTSPSDKWVVNTESAFDYAQQAYYLPVRIEGFDVNYRGFDHIELQYKLSTQGDKDWINVCAFYNDRELMALASGVVDSIPADGAIQTRFFGEADPIEQHYDLRAVVYCRYGNGFLTAASPVLTGIKDTRRPVPFGTPTPVSGVLGIGDDIAISFSEDIAGNYLSKINNFEVLGSPRSGDISTSTCLSFTDNSAAMSAAPLNLTGKSFTVDLMLNPAATQKAMTVFAHGGDEQGLKFGLTEDRRLTAIVNGKQVSSDTSVPFNGLRQVAYALEQGSDAMTIRFYDGSRLIGQQQISGVYRGNSELLLGFDFDILVDPQASTLSYYNGDMLEFRIWNRVLSAAEMAEYGQKSLTGYEHGLLCNYTLNEGEGRYSYDRAVSGIDLELNGTSWKRPQGVAMHFDGRDGICLKPDCFARTDAQDYTLMFWFNTAEAEGTLLANGEARNEPEARNHINVGLDGGRLFVRSGGREFRTEATCNDAQWHHFAMTVSRSRNVGNIYVDKRLVESFSVDSLGGIQGNNLALGATYTSATNALRPLRGYIDEVGLFSSVLPVNLLQSYVNKTPTGTESSLLAYLDFGRNEQQDDNTQRLMPTGISRKRYKDARGNLVARRDTLVAQDVIEAHAARDSYAPITRNNKLDNVNFSYVANGNKLLLNLDVPDFQIEKSNVYVTVKDVQDMNGNYMASPLTMDFYVYRNPLRWNVQHVELNTAYGEEQSFEVTIRNLSGQTQRFQLRDLPYWLSASLTQGSIAALDEQIITFCISPYTNIGSYTELITLAADNDMTEPLSLNVKVAGEQPAWAVSDDLKANNLVMNIVARAYIDGVVAADPNDILVAFGPNQEVMGVAHIDADQTANANEVLTWLTVYGYRNQATELEFRIYDASSGQVYKLQPRGNQRVTFQADAILGSSTSPLLLENADSSVETLHLRKGWNWVSFNVAQKEAVTLGELFYGAAPWQHGDAIEIINDKSATTYFCRKDQTIRGYKWDKDNQLVQIDPTRMYRIYSGSKKVAYFGGQTVDDDITVHHGWNRIAYLSQLNLPIAQAMSVYLSEASEGDVLKSQDDFAILSRDASGNLVWKGTLRYLETGRGYMLKRTADNDATFYYPSYYADSRYSGSTSAPRRTTLLENSSATSMNIVARVSGVEQQEDDRLVAYNGTCRIGVAQADEDGLFFLNLAQAEGEARSLTFCLERNEQVVGTALSNYSYEADAVIGSPDQPTGIYFAPSAYDYSDGHWYTLDGVRLPRKPQRAGLYIHNGKVTNEK